MTPIELIFFLYMLISIAGQHLIKKAQKVLNSNNQELADKVKKLEDKQEEQEQYIQMLAGIRKPAQLETSSEEDRK